MPKVSEGFGSIDSDGEGEGGGGGVQERGDSCNLSPESSPLRSSSSQRRLAAFLMHLAGGGEAVGDCSGVGDGVGAFSGLGWGAARTNGYG
jgi:hypothetical protein